MYKDKERQREAVREATRRWRVSQGITEKVSRVSPKEEGITVTPVIKTKADAVKAVSKIKKVERWPNGRCRCHGLFECV
jgi:hypothetical protein